MGKGVPQQASLRLTVDPSLGKDESGMALLRMTPDLFRKLMRKGILMLALLRSIHDPSFKRRSLRGIAAYLD